MGFRQTVISRRNLEAFDKDTWRKETAVMEPFLLPGETRDWIGGRTLSTAHLVLGSAFRVSDAA